MPIGIILDDGGTGTGWDGTVANFAALPAAAAHTNEVYLVQNSTGFLWNRRKGLYDSDGVNWNRLSNVTFQVQDNEASFRDNIDTSKELVLQLSNIAPATTRILTVPDQNITVDDDGDSRPPNGAAGGDLGGTYPNPTVNREYTYDFFADQMETPVNADWAVNALAPAGADANNNGLTIRLFDDTIEEGIGFSLYIPVGMTNMALTFIGRAETAPGAARTVGLKLYERGLPGAVDAWSAGTVLTDIDIPTNENWIEDTQSDTLANWGLTAGQVHQFELTRINPTGGVELTGDWDLLMVGVEFT